MFIHDENFKKRGLDEANPGDPVYWANKQFYPELSDNIIFCGAAHSLQWYEENKLKSKEQ